MKRPGPLETKVAASGITGAAVSLLLQLLATYVHSFHAPPPATTALLVTVVAAVAGWLAPHTPRAAALQSAQERADFEKWVAAGKPLIVPLRTGAGGGGGITPAVQPSATSTGAASQEGPA